MYRAQFRTPTTATTITVTDDPDGGCVIQRRRERINMPPGWISHIEISEWRASNTAASWVALQRRSKSYGYQTL